MLLEALVGIFLFATAFTAVMTMVAGSLSLLGDARRTFIATRAAREGMEMMLGKYENNAACLLSGSCPISTWQDNLIGVWEVDATKANQIDPQKKFDTYTGRKLCVAKSPPREKGKFTPCQGGSDVPLAGAVTRKVTVQWLDNEKAYVVVEVSWDRRSSGSRHTMRLEEMLYGKK